MKDNTELMPYLRNMDKARTQIEAKAVQTSNEYQRLLKERDKLFHDGMRLVLRGEQSDNQKLYEQGKLLMSRANALNPKIELLYKEYEETERKLAKLRRK
jgi:hypothetical protein